MEPLRESKAFDVIVGDAHQSHAGREAMGAMG